MRVYGLGFWGARDSGFRVILSISFVWNNDVRKVLDFGVCASPRYFDLNRVLLLGLRIMRISKYGTCQQDSPSYPRRGHLQLNPQRETLNPKPRTQNIPKP